MEIYKTEKEEIVRISFGPNVSISFKKTTVDDVYKTFIRVFENHTIKKTVDLKNHSPLKKLSSENAFTVTVRHEFGKVKASESKSKRLYFISPPEAMQIFKENYQKYI